MPMIAFVSVFNKTMCTQFKICNLNTNLSLPDRVAKLCIDAYNKLTKCGKPSLEEHTVLAAIVQYDYFNECLEVVSIGTGTKCIGACEMTTDGHILNDSHAEVIARRGFLLYLYDNIKSTAGGETTIFRIEDDKFKLDENIHFYFYSSQLPCGDACIILKSDFSHEESIGDIIILENQSDDEIADNDPKRRRLDEDIYRTGAKCLPTCEQDKREPGIDYHVIGQVRTKPGRGAQTASVSCSDKMARWIHVGIQGALVDMFLHQPIYIKLFVFGGGVPYSQETIERALLYRNRDPSQVKLKCVPKLEQCSFVFPHLKSKDRPRVAPGSILWVKQKVKPCHEVATKGRKQGVVKKRKDILNSALSISKYNLYANFLSILLCLEEKVYKKVMGEEVNLSTAKNIPYNEMKRKSKTYMANWDMLKKNFFTTWTSKPVGSNFLVTIIDNKQIN